MADTHVHCRKHVQLQVHAGGTKTPFGKSEEDHLSHLTGLHSNCQVKTKAIALVAEVSLFLRSKLQENVDGGGAMAAQWLTRTVLKVTT